MEEGEEEEEGEQLGLGLGRHIGITEVKWFVPEGFEIAPEPDVLDGRLVGKSVFFRWQKYGWQLGKITAEITNATPRLFKKFNYRVVWADQTKGPAKLGVDNYGHGASARYDSWVILTPAAPIDQCELP